MIQKSDSKKLCKSINCQKKKRKKKVRLQHTHNKEIHREQSAEDRSNDINQPTFIIHQTLYATYIDK